MQLLDVFKLRVKEQSGLKRVVVVANSNNNCENPAFIASILFKDVTGEDPAVYIADRDWFYATYDCVNKELLALDAVSMWSNNLDCKELTVGASYQHYRGGQYTLIGIAKSTGTLTGTHAFYQSDDGVLYSRPTSVFVNNFKRL